MTFNDLNLGKSLLRALDDLDLTTPTAIQSKVFAPIMAGEDVVGIAQTGTGKTFAYLLPLLRLWKFNKSAAPQIMVVVPTRELVAQVTEELEKLTPYMNVVVRGVYGGTNIRTQRASLIDGLDVIVGTPGRLVDLMADGALKTKQIKRLVIDEVDEMLNLGFRTQLKNIIDYLPKKRQHLMFSATMTEEVMAVIEQYTDHYQQIETAPSGAPLENIKQSLYRVPNFNTKANLLEHLLKTDDQIKKLLVFIKSRRFADALYERMYPVFEETVGIIHASKSQNYRFDSVRFFQDGTYRCLIATDVIARGLDVSGVTHVINFDLPDAPEKYIHRIGRTGRAEEEGIAIAFVAEDDQDELDKIEALTGMTIPQSELPEVIEISDELIDLEKKVDIAPFDPHKNRRRGPSGGGAFHEKKEKNKKENRRESRKEKMMKKYGKPIKRGSKKK